MRPAIASRVASAAPSCSLRKRVSTLPRMATTVTSGRKYFTCAWRRSEEVATTAPCGRSPRRGAVRLMKASRTSSRGRKHATVRPAGSSVGMSFIECTAMSASPASNASSISLVKSPLPPASLSGRSWMRSPVVLMARISNACRPGPCAASSRCCTSRACASASGEPRVAMRILPASKLPSPGARRLPIAGSLYSQIITLAARWGKWHHSCHSTGMTTLRPFARGNDGHDEIG